MTFTTKISDWMKKNPSVYVLKTWEQVFYEAKRDLFSSMYDKSLDWPKVFWESYKGDSVDPNLSMINLINASLLGRIKVTNDKFDKELLSGGSQTVSKKELQSVIEGISFIREEEFIWRRNKIRGFIQNPKGKVFCLMYVLIVIVFQEKWKMKILMMLNYTLLECKKLSKAKMAENTQQGIWKF